MANRLHQTTFRWCRATLLMVAVTTLLQSCVSAPTQTEVPALPQQCTDPTSRYVLSSETAERSIMILAGDEHPDAARRHLSLVERVGRSVMDELVAPGIRLFDHGGLTVTLPKKRRLKDSEILDSVKNDAREPIDRLVVYSVFADTYPEDNNFQTRLRVEARVYDMPAGNLIGGGYEAATTAALNVPAVCNSACFKGLIGDAARPLGAEVGRKLAHQVASMGRSYPIDLHGFTSGERQRIEDEIRAFPGYRSHRVIEDTSDFVRMHYASQLLATDLGHNLRALTDCLNIPSRVEFARDRYVVRRSDG